MHSNFVNWKVCSGVGDRMLCCGNGEGERAAITGGVQPSGGVMLVTLMCALLCCVERHHSIILLMSLSLVCG